MRVGLPDHFLTEKTFEAILSSLTDQLLQINDNAECAEAFRPVKIHAVPAHA